MAEGTEKEVMNLLTEFLVVNIDEKVLQGISYLIIPKNDANKAKIEKFDGIRKRLTELNVPENEQFRVYDMHNAMIYEIELRTAIEITEKLSRAVGAAQTTDFGIAKTSYARQQDDINRLVKYCVKMAQKGTSEFQVALFSKNKVPTINVTCKDKVSGKSLIVTYEAFALRHTDIVEVNKRLIDCGLKIVRVVAHDALPSMTGVVVTLGLVAVR